MNIIVEKQPKKYLLRLGDDEQLRLEKAIDGLKELKGNIKHLQGTKNEYRLRVGDTRVIFKTSGENIIITKIGPRGDVYK